MLLGLDGKYVSPRLDVWSGGTNRCLLARNKPLGSTKYSHYPTAVSNNVAVVSTIVQDDFCVSELLMVYKQYHKVMMEYMDMRINS